MNEETKITLSAKELELVSNTDWILTKHAIIEKVYQLFGTLSTRMEEAINKRQSILPSEWSAGKPKISRGENYRLLPYVMLDYPRFFSRKNTLAIRTFFWWGNFFSIYLQASGEAKASTAEVLTLHFLLLQENDFWVCINTDPWQHHFEKDNFVPIKKISAALFEAILNREPFLKIGKKIPLQQYDVASSFIMQSFLEIITMLKFSYPDGEKDPLPGTPTIGSGL